VLWILLSCGEEPESVTYCPQSRFEEAVVEAYCTQQEECGGYESKSVCVADQDWSLDCGDSLYNPTVAQECLNAIAAYDDGCWKDLEDMFYLEDGDRNGASGEGWPGNNGCGRLWDGDELVDKLCVSPNEATEICNVTE